MKCGLPLAAAVNDCDWNASVIFEDVVDELLRSHPWGFAQRYAVLTASDGTPAHGFNYRYAVPADWMRTVDLRAEHDLRAPKARYAMEGRFILCNIRPANLRYVARILEPAGWTPDFANAAAARIAVEIAALSAESMALVPQLTQLAQIAFGQAQLNDAREATERVPLAEPLREARSQSR